MTIKCKCEDLTIDEFLSLRDSTAILGQAICKLKRSIAEDDGTSPDWKKMHQIDLKRLETIYDKLAECRGSLDVMTREHLIL